MSRSAKFRFHNLPGHLLQSGYSHHWRRRCQLVAVLALMWMMSAGHARADVWLYAGADLEIGAPLGKVNLGDQVGQPIDEGDDLNQFIGGFIAELGMQIDSVAIGVNMSIALGGLDLSRIERAYYEIEDEQLGASFALSAGVTGRYHFYYRGAWSFYGATELGMTRLGASSPAATANVDVFYLDAGVGVSRRISSVRIASERSDINLAIALRTHRVWRAFLGSAADESVAPMDPAYFFAPRLVLSYRVYF